MYSRLGGSYRSRRTKKKGGPDSVAYFPIYVTMRSESSEGETLRAIGGVCVRGPQHARAPTDRIAICTVEMIKRTPLNSKISAYINEGVVYVCTDYLIIVRQNSIMKEDPCYQGFFSLLPTT